MISTLVPGVGRLVNRLGGRHGEYAASALLNRMPAAWVPSAGTHRVRRQGLQWQLDLRDNLQKRLYLVGAYESLTLRALRSLVRPGDIVLDVGANIGAIALPIARNLLGSGRVIAVEAAVETAAQLRSHVVDNGLDDRVQVVQTALSDRIGSARLRRGDFGAGDVGTLTLEGEEQLHGDPVPLTTGDELRQRLGVERFDVLKIDVEGHEMAVLAGLSQTFAERPPRVVLLEVVAENQARAGGSATALVDRMHELGYRGHAVRHRGVVPLTPTFSGNVIFLRTDAVAG
jgi:FkbM family methyltransferase